MQNHDETNIRELMTSARRGDAGALNALCMILHEQVIRKITGKLRDDDDSKEIAQEVIVWFVRNYRERIHDENIPALLVSKAFFMLKSHFRAKYALKEVALESAADLAVEDGEEALDENLDRSETSRMIAAGLARLPETYQAVITRRYFQEMSFKEIGVELNLAEENVRQRHARGLAALRKHLKVDGRERQGKRKREKGKVNPE